MAKNDLNNNGIPDLLERPEEQQLEQPQVPIALPQVPIVEQSIPVEEIDPIEADKRIRKIEKGFELQQDALQAGAILGVAKSAEQGAMFRESKQRMINQENKRIDNEQKRQQFLVANLDKLQQTRDEISKVENFKTGIFEGKTTGQKIAAGIAILLGGIGAGLTGKENMGLRAVNDQVDRNIEAQKFKLTKLKGKEDATESILGIMRAKFSDERQAESATRLSILDQMKIKTQQMASKYKAPELQTRAAGVIGQIEVEKQKELIKFQSIDDKIATKIEQNASINDLKKLAISGQNKDAEPLTSEQLAQLDMAFPKQDFRKRAVTLSDGYIRIARDAKTKENLDKATIASSSVLNSVDRLEALMQKHGTDEVINRAAVKAEESIREAMALELKELANLGVLNGPDREILDNISGGQFFGFKGLARSDDSKFAAIKELKAYINQKSEVRAQQAGLVAVDTKRKAQIALLMSKKKINKDEAEAEIDRLISQGKISTTGVQIK